MDKYNKDTLANLISCELHRMRDMMQLCNSTGNAEGVKYWIKEIKDLEKLDAEIWKYV